MISYTCTMHRLSNIELLRIFLIFMIVLGHIVNHSIVDCFGENLSFSEKVLSLITICSIPAVNCFVMISGYFGIKSNYLGGIKLWFQCVWYLAISVVGSIIITGNNIDIKTFTYDVILCVFSYGAGLWFIVSYFMLYCLAPFLNKYIDGCNKIDFNKTVLMLCLFDIIIGYIFRIGIYDYWHFITLYFIGKWLRNNKETITDIFSRRMLFFVFILSLFFFKILSLLPIPIIPSGYTNANPFVVISAASLLLIFMKTNIKHNESINFVAKGCLAVYILHENTWIRPILVEYISQLRELIGSSLYTYILVFAVILLFALVSVFDSVRRFVSDNIIVKLSSHLKNMVCNTYPQK